MLKHCVFHTMSFLWSVKHFSHQARGNKTYNLRNREKRSAESTAYMFYFLGSVFHYGSCFSQLWIIADLSHTFPVLSNLGSKPYIPKIRTSFSSPLTQWSVAFNFQLVRNFLSHITKCTFIHRIHENKMVISREKKREWECGCWWKEMEE